MLTSTAGAGSARALPERHSMKALIQVFSTLCVVALALPAVAKAEGKVKVGFILSTMQEERYQRDKKMFEDTARAMGAEVVFASCNNSEQTQAAEVDNLLSQGVKALVIQ